MNVAKHRAAKASRFDRMTPVIPESLGDPIASRELMRSGSDQPIHVLIWQPFEEGEEVWACPYQIRGFGDGTVRYARGSDAVQALQLSFTAIRANLDPKRNHIYWIAPDIADAGFPRTVNYAFGSDMYDYLCDLMDRELLPYPDEYMRCKRYRAKKLSQWKRERDFWRRSGRRQLRSTWQPRKGRKRNNT
jgi:uncharacterized protein DUF6968